MLQFHEYTKKNNFFQKITSFKFDRARQNFPTNLSHDAVIRKRFNLIARGSNASKFPKKFFSQEILLTMP